MFIVVDFIIVLSEIREFDADRKKFQNRFRPCYNGQMGIYRFLKIAPRFEKSQLISYLYFNNDDYYPTCQSRLTNV